MLVMNCIKKKRRANKMKLKEVYYKGEKYTRISWAKVKNIIDKPTKLKSNLIIYTLPINANPNNPWINGFYEIEVEKTLAHKDSIDYYNEINEIIYYNCNRETGEYLAYYIKE